MPTKLPYAPSSSGDPLGVDENYQAYEYDPIEDEWVPGTVMEERKRQREAANPQPEPPPAGPETPPTPPERPAVSLPDPQIADTAAQLSEATIAASSAAAAAPAPPAQAPTVPSWAPTPQPLADPSFTPATPDKTNDTLTADREMEAQGFDMRRGGGIPNGAPVSGDSAAAAGRTQITDAVRQRRIDAALRSQAQGQAESEGQSAPQSVPADLQQTLAGSGGVDTGQQWADPYHVGNVFNGPTGMRPPQNEREMAIFKGDISTSSNLLVDKVGQAAADAYSAEIPIVSPALKYARKQATTAAKAVAPIVGDVVDMTPLGMASRLPSLLGIDTPTAGDVTKFGIEQAPSMIPVSLGDIATTLPIGELAGAGRVAGRLARAGGVAARDAAARVAESDAARSAAAAVREGVTAGEFGGVRNVRPGGGTAREAALRRSAENRNLGGGLGEVDGRAMRQAAPLSEEMQFVGEGVQLDPVALGVSTDRKALTAAIAEIRANPTGRTTELGRLQAQLDALKAIEEHDAVGAFNVIADAYANTRATSPNFQAMRDEFGRIHNAMFDPEAADRFAANALREPPAGAAFDPITHEIQLPGSKNTSLKAAPAPTPAAAGGTVDEEIARLRQVIRTGQEIRGGDIVDNLDGERRRLSDLTRWKNDHGALNSPAADAAAGGAKASEVPLDYHTTPVGAQDLKLAPQAAPATPAPAPQLPGTESAVDVASRPQAAPVLGSMKTDEQIFRGEQGGMQPSILGPDEAARVGGDRFQPGLADQVSATDVRQVAPAGTPATDIRELDNLLEVRQQIAAEQAILDRMERAGMAQEAGGSGGRMVAEQRAKVAAVGSAADVDRRIVELGKLTELDDADIIWARAENMAKDVPESPAMHDEWTQTLRSQGGLAHPEPGDLVEIRRERLADIVLGPPAAGKNTAAANPLRRQRGAMLIDSDEAKELIPGFGKGRFAGAVHVESDKISHKLMADSIGAGENVVIPLVGKNKAKIDALGRKLIEAGYTVRLHYVDLPQEKAAERAVERFHNTGRFVDPNYVLNEVDGHPRRTFDDLKGADWVSGYERKSNDVARGQPAITIESSFARSTAAESAPGPGINDRGLADLGNRGGENAAAPTPIRAADSEPIPGLAESLRPENQRRMARRADAVREGGTAAADEAGINLPTVSAPRPPRLAPDTGPYVRQPDGTTVEATADSVAAGVKRVLTRSSGVRIPVNASPDEAIAVIRQAVKDARTTGGRSLFGPGTDERLIDEAVNNIILDGKIKIAATGGRGRIGATFVADNEEGALKSAIDEAGINRPEAGIENALSEPAAAGAGNAPPRPPEGPPASTTAPDAVPADAAAEWSRLQQQAQPAPSRPIPPKPVDARQSVAPSTEGPAGDINWQGVSPDAQKEWDALQRGNSQQRLAQGLETSRNQTMQTPDFAPEGRGSAGGGSGVPPAGGQGQAAFPWKPGQPMGRRLLKAGADLIFGLPRAMKFGMDQSAPLRQGLWDMISHPGITVAGAPKRLLENGLPNPAFGRGQGKMLAEFATHPAREATNIIQSIYHADGALVQQWRAFGRALGVDVRHPSTIFHPNTAETDRVYARIGQRYSELKGSITDTQGNVLPGLYKAERGAKAPLSAREEQVATSILDNVPLLRRLTRAGEDSFAMFLSKQRDDVFDNWVDTYRRLTGELPSKQEANDIARWVNIKSGRGELPQNWANAFTVPFTAPRLYAAQVERLPMIAPFMLRSGEVRKQMMGDWVKVFGALSASLAMASEFGLGSVDVNVHSPSADFLKIRIGNHRIDPWGGYAQLARLSARLVSGLRSSGGVVYDSTWRDELTNFALSKLAPTAALANDILSGHDFDHNQLHWDWESVKKEVQNTYAPLLFQDLITGFQEDGLRGLALSAPTFFGLSVSTYPPGITELRTKAAAAEGYKSFAEAPLSVQDRINAQPDIAKLAASQPQSDYKKAKEQSYGPIDAAQATAEASFKAGTNDTLIQDLWHDEVQQKIGARAALEAAFTKTFNSHQKNDFTKALDGYLAIALKRPDGSPDYEATDQARRDYLAGKPQTQQDWITDFMDVGASKQTPLRQEYFKYLDARKAAGYFDLDPKAKDYAAKLAELDKANPDLDVQNWYWKNTTAGAPKLNSVAAVDKALAMIADNPGRTVKANLDNIGSVSRPISGNEDAWTDSKALLQKFADAKDKFAEQERRRLAASNNPNAASYNKPLSQLTAAQLSSIHANIAKSLQTNSPQLDALLAYWGISDTLNSAAAVAEYRKLQAKYGKDPATPTTVVKVAAGAK